MEKLKLTTEDAEMKMKERLKDVNLEDDKQKQKNKLKEIQGECESATATIKNPRIKKPIASFTDLIGVPGAKESKQEKIIIKEKHDQAGKGDRDSHKETDDSNSDKKVKDNEFKDATGFGEFFKPETMGISPVKERRHRVKVYVSTKSKNMDLFETMMKGSKINPKLITADAKAEKSSKSGSFEDAVSDTSTSSSERATKRSTIDSATKTGTTKKLKFDEPLLKDKKQNSKDKSSEDKKGKDEENSANNRNIIKPIINFHRGTLADVNATTSDSNKRATTTYFVGSVNAISAAATTTTETDSGNVGDSVINNLLDDFAPEEGKLKSSLRIHRPKGTAKKLVRWRKDEELKVFHCFEMDKTEIVNVTKQIKKFSEMKLMEISEEKSSNSRTPSLKQKGFGNQSEERFSWLKPRPIIFPVGKVYHEANSKEEHIQDERERIVHELFYLPGSILPDHPSEVDVINMEIDSNHIPTMISADDVPVVTKICDYRSKPSPTPNIGVGVISSSKYQSNNPDAMQSFIAQNDILMQVPSIDHIPAFANASYNPAAQQVRVPTLTMDTYTPWVTQEVAGFLPGFQTAGNAPQMSVFQPLQACGFPSFPTLPPAVGNMEVSQMEQQPHLSQPQPVSPPENFGAFGMPEQFDPTLNTGGEDSGYCAQQQGQSQGIRDFRDVDYREMLRNDTHSDLVIRGTQNECRDHHRRPRRGGSCSRGRRRARGRDRAERYDNGRGYSRRSNDQGSYNGSTGGRRKQTPCYYFVKGFCREGNKCPFLHLGGAGTSTNNSNSLSTIDDDNNSRRPPNSPPPSSSGRYYEKSRCRSPPWTNTELSTNYLSFPPNNTLSIDSNSYSSSRSREIPKIEPRSPDADRFDLPPSSPSENHNHSPGTDEMKFIPTFTEDDWV